MTDTSDKAMRAEFERWMSYNGSWPRAIQRSGGDYLLAQAASSWTAWQASWHAARSAPPVAPVDRDALRYRWLRDSRKTWREDIKPVVMKSGDLYSDGLLDEAIDAAMLYDQGSEVSR